MGSAFRTNAAPGAQVIETPVISQPPQMNHGRPAIARRRNGQLEAVGSVGREQHVCPIGRVELMVSGDEGVNRI